MLQSRYTTSSTNVLSNYQTENKNINQVQVTLFGYLHVQRQNKYVLRMEYGVIM